MSVPRVAIDPELTEVAVGAAEAVAQLGVRVAEDDPEVEALIVRSATRVDDAFLAARPRLRWLATASSGADHLDQAALAARSVAWCNTPGANAEAVADWVEIALSELQVAPGPRDKASTVGTLGTVGIVGVGHVGRAVARRLGDQGWQLLLCDPPRAQAEPDFPHVPLDALLAQADVLTLHVPLDATTRHLVDAAALARLRGAVLLNASRGDVLDGEAALAWALAGGHLALDVWPGEPHPRPELVAATRLATPHVAGHTDAGKCEPVRRALAWLAEQLGQPGAAIAVHPPAGAGEAVATLRRADQSLRDGEDFRRVRAASVRAALRRRARL